MKVGTFIGFGVGALAALGVAKLAETAEKEDSKQKIKEKIIEMLD